MKTINDRLSTIIENWPCCNLATVPISELPEGERSFFESYEIEARTAIALAHHVTNKEEWRWYKTDTDGEHSKADDHLKTICEDIKRELLRSGHQSEIVKYPGESGLQFRFVAQSAGLGIIGTNAFLFHPVWGPWVHLRVIATTADLNIRSRILGDQLCNRCMLCISECPADAISDETFSGEKCRSYRKSRGEYTPCGKNKEYRYCLRCILICPQGHRPYGN